MNGYITLVKKEVYRFMSMSLQTILGPMTTAILYQLIFGKQLSSLMVGNVSYAEFLIPGLIMMQILLNAFGNSSSSLIQSKYTGNIIFILMAPISPLAMYLGYLTGSVIRGLIVGFAVFIAIVWFGGGFPHSITALLFFAILGASITGGLGIIAGILSEKFDQLAGFQSFVMVPLIYLSGVFFSTHGLPYPWDAVAHLNPFLYIVDGFRYGFTLHTHLNMYVSTGFVLSMAIVINTVGYLLLKYGVKIKR